MKTVISDLPRDSTEEILARLPIKSTRAVRLTCKNWNTISKSKRSFARGEKESSTMIALMDNSLYLKSVDIDHPSIELKGKLSCLNEQVKISQVFHCEGLLLCVLENDTRLVVWNPYCCQTTWIEPRWYPHNRNGLDLLRYAIGYEDKNSCRSFKLLRFIDYTKCVGRYSQWTPPKRFSWYEIYDFDSGLWTTLDVTPRWYIAPCEIGLSLKGNTYWCASTLNGFANLICFDFTRERFGPFLPLPFSVRDHEYVSLSCVREEKLSVFSQIYHDHESSYPYELQIWVTTNVDVEKVSWSNVFKFRTEHHPVDVSYISSYYFIDEEKEVAMGFDISDKRFIIFGDAGYIRQLDLKVPVMIDSENLFFRPRVCSYVPSLVQIKKPTRGKRGRQYRLEKRRFAQNMLRLFATEL